MSSGRVPIQAIILAGGKGTRLSRVYPSIPKALVPIAGKPFIERQLEWLAERGVSSACLATGHLSGLLEDWAASGPVKPVTISISREPVPLGTAGAIKFAASSIKRDLFLVLNGDTLLPSLSLERMIEAHTRAGAALSLAAVRMQSAGRYGTIEFDAAGRIAFFHEKAERSEGWVNGGAYLVNHGTLDRIETGRNISIETEVFPALAEAGVLNAFPCPPPLLDMGTPEGVAEMERFLAS